MRRNRLSSSGGGTEAEASRTGCAESPGDDSSRRADRHGVGKQSARARGVCAVRADDRAAATRRRARRAARLSRSHAAVRVTKPKPTSTASSRRRDMTSADDVTTLRCRVGCRCENAVSSGGRNDMPTPDGGDADGAGLQSAQHVEPTLAPPPAARRRAADMTEISPRPSASDAVLRDGNRAMPSASSNCVICRETAEEATLSRRAHFCARKAVPRRSRK